MNSNQEISLYPSTAACSNPGRSHPCDYFSNGKLRDKPSVVFKVRLPPAVFLIIGKNLSRNIRTKLTFLVKQKIPSETKGNIS